MPDEYISREKTLALLKSLGSRDYRREKGTIQDAIKMISSSAYTPAADVAQVVHGQWKKVRESRSTWERSACGTKVGAFFVGCSQYCYCCGAQMGGVSE
jgi:hypothetical protein